MWSSERPGYNGLKKKKKKLERQGNFSSQISERCLELTRLEMKKRQKQEGLLEAGVDLGFPGSSKHVDINTGTAFSPLLCYPWSRMPRIQPSYSTSTVPPFHRGASHCNLFSNDRDQMISDANQNIFACETKCS